MIITSMLSLLLVPGQSKIQPAFLGAECGVPNAHQPVVLSEIEFSMDCTTLLDFGSSLSWMSVTVSSSIDGIIFNGTLNSSKIVPTYNSGNVDGFSIKDLKVKSLGDHFLTVAISQRTIDLVTNAESITNLIESVSRAKCIHGFGTILPPIAVLLVCLITKQVMIALPFAVWFGAWMIDPDWNPVTSFERIWDTYYVEAIGNVGHAFGITFAIFLAGLVKVLERTGGTQGITKLVAERVRSSRSAALGVFAVGLMIFFDDYADCLISGYTFMPLMDQYHVSREKFAFIVDATAAPIASTAPLSSWIGFELILVQAYFTDADVWGDDEKPGAYISFLKTIPYRFYPIFMIWFMFFTLYFRYDFGPMLKAEKRVKLSGQISRSQRKSPVPDEAFKAQVAEIAKIEPRPLNGIIPIMSVIFLTLLGFILTGINSCRLKGVEHTAKNIFSNGNSFAALVYSVVIGNVIAFAMALCQQKFNDKGEKVRLVSLSDLFHSFFKGVGVLCEPVFGILVFAWSLNGIVKDLRMGDYMISAVGDSMDIKSLPVVTFLLSGLMSLFIGSSFATMTLIFPLIVPLALHVSENDKEATIAVMGTILAGSVWGDHCSPMSDTTILSSMSSGCDHNDHVATQLPYAVFVAFFSTIFGDLCVGYMGFEYPYIGIIVGVSLRSLCTFSISSRVPSYYPDGPKIADSDFKKSTLSSFIASYYPDGPKIADDDLNEKTFGRDENTEEIGHNL